MKIEQKHVRPLPSMRAAEFRSDLPPYHGGQAEILRHIASGKIEGLFLHSVTFTYDEAGLRAIVNYEV